MKFQIDAKDYAAYILRAYECIHAKGEYVTDLDLATGDGDHWANLDMGFKALAEKAQQLQALRIDEAFKEIGKTMMSVIGGSSGVLYGSAYLAAAKTAKDKTDLDERDLCEVLQAMLDAMMSRGQAQPGFKTMIDSLAPAVEVYRLCLKEDCTKEELCERVKAAAQEGAESTRNMEAVKGRASYQSNKGLGHLDPGAVTMSYQISELMDFIRTK